MVIGLGKRAGRLAEVMELAQLVLHSGVGTAFEMNARVALTMLLFCKDVPVAVVEKVRYGPWIGRLMQAMTDMSLRMVTCGFAWYYMQFDKSQEFADAEASARSRKN